MGRPPNRKRLTQYPQLQKRASPQGRDGEAGSASEASSPRPEGARPTRLRHRHQNSDRLPTSGKARRAVEKVDTEGATKPVTVRFRRRKKTTAKSPTQQ